MNKIVMEIAVTVLPTSTGNLNIFMNICLFNMFAGKNSLSSTISPDRIP